MIKKLPLKCPSCEHQLQVKQMSCPECATEVSGHYSLPILAQLSPDDQRLIVDFVKASGSLKEMSLNLKLSYPTVRNLLDDTINRIKLLESYEQK